MATPRSRKADTHPDDDGRVDDDIYYTAHPEDEHPEDEQSRYKLERYQNMCALKAANHERIVSDIRSVLNMDSTAIRATVMCYLTESDVWIHAQTDGDICLRTSEGAKNDIDAAGGVKMISTAMLEYAEQGDLRTLQYIWLRRGMALSAQKPGLWRVLIQDLRLAGVRSGNLDILRWLWHAGCGDKEETSIAEACFAEAAISGKPDIIKWIFNSTGAASDHDSVTHPYICIAAAATGNLKMLEWAQANDFWCVSVRQWALLGGHAVVIAWIDAQDRSKYPIDDAKNEVRSRTDRDPPPPLSSENMVTLLKCVYQESFEYDLNEGLSRDVTNAISNYDNIELLRFVCFHGWPWTVHATLRVLQRGQFDFLSEMWGCGYKTGDEYADKWVEQLFDVWPRPAETMDKLVFELNRHPQPSRARMMLRTLSALLA